eukprot:CAMPEP_0204302760 /NCGR_PEP_ID=MMETSP0468-20130131/82696_1 /ASSEMBLY_ACC=CAM_ASM_000383 /TAXON_ID=2969 /ORGANISM="Oxyrrhis marina" /LENGTH=47 /DNA_ID= /DNA_START= /DNA_END= /DNA_ORIENTATION=
MEQLERPVSDNVGLRRHAIMMASPRRSRRDRSAGVTCAAARRRARGS